MSRRFTLSAVVLVALELVSIVVPMPWYVALIGGALAAVLTKPRRSPR